MEIFSSKLSTQILNKASGNPSASMEIGDISPVMIKERGSDGEAKVLWKGQETAVKFDGPVPTEDRALVEIKGQTADGKIILKAVSASAQSNVQRAEELLSKAGFDPKMYPELKEAVKQILSRGGKVSREELKPLQDFLKNEAGTLAVKLETIKLIQQRGLDFTKIPLQSVHVALNEPEAIADWLNNAINEEKQSVSNKTPDPSVLEEVPIDDDKIALRSVDSKDLHADSKLLAESSIMKAPNESLPLSKDILVTKISEKLSQMTMDFSKIKKEIGWGLETVSKLIKVKNAPQAKQNLEATIAKLDKAILKGNFMLYADMSTEKDLLSASTKLAEAKSLVSKGDFAQAQQIVKEVKGQLDQINFKPSQQKIQHFTIESQNTLTTALEPKTGSRSIFEMVKAVGLTHEIDVEQALSKGDSPVENVKSILLQLQESGSDQPKVAQALAAITGQQLLSRQDTSGVQNLFLQLPLLLNQQVENVKVLVNSQKNGEKIDWENCSLYFVLETKKLGEIGISLTAANRNLSLTFKSDREELQSAIQPLTEEVKENLQEIGYSIGSIQFKRLTPEEDRQSVEKPTKAERKGFDFTV